MVAAAQGYPEAPRPGDRIDELETAEDLCDAVYCAGVAQQGRSLVTSGGRVLSLVGVGDDLATARERAYAGLEGLRFDGLYVRRDIGLNVVEDEDIGSDALEDVGSESRRDLGSP